MNGVVKSFDEHVGLGVVQSQDGAEFSFHCTQIADGSRIIDAGTPVTFTVRTSHHGHDEAMAITKL